MISYVMYITLKTLSFELWVYMHIHPKNKKIGCYLS